MTTTRDGSDRTSDRSTPAPTLGRLDRVTAAVLAGALALPPVVQRGLAGRRVVRDSQVLDVDIQLLLRLQRLAREPEFGAGSLSAGRASMLRQTLLSGGRQPIGESRDLVAGGRPARLYVPRRAEPKGPLLVFLHGGAFMFGDLDTHDAACRFLAEHAEVRVLAIDYRLAPEHPFPAAYEDCVAAYRWVVDHADDLEVDVDRIGVGGDSAGGNLAAGVALAAAREGLPCAVQLLLYPVTARSRDTRSAQLFGEGFFLTKATMDLADRSYLAGGDRTDPRYAPLVEELTPETAAALAPALLHTAGFDPLRDEGEAYGAKLRDAGVSVTQRRFSGSIHGFLNMVGIGRSSAAAVTLVAADLRVALAAGAAGGRPTLDGRPDVPA